jgi:murein DD-endopeptidase MepM/ murein hydrolase activator NlpD
VQRVLNIQQRANLWNRIDLLEFLYYFPEYVLIRSRQVSLVVIVAFEIIGDYITKLKNEMVRRMFWGRGNWYKNSFHLLILSFTGLALVTGLASKSLLVEAKQGLDVAYGQGASSDILEQGGSIHTVLAVDPLQPAITMQSYEVGQEESLTVIAEQYNVTEDTIRWANSDLISPFSNEVETGWRLKIPQINGVLYRVHSGQSIDDIASVTGGNKIDIIELNQLVPPDYKIVEGQRLFIPNGSLSVSEVRVEGIPQGVFENPLSNPECSGYTYSRGYSGYHDGVDLARYPGCPVRTIATGTIVFAGWSPLAGFNVRVDHGGGIVSKYYHGDGTFWVKVGDRVQQGQEIMMMGTSGNSTGVHLHISLFKNEVPVDPAFYIPL